MDKQIEELYKVYEQHPNVITDSRKVEKGSIFFALKGPNFDGNKYAQDAMDQGAACVVIDDQKLHINGKAIVVDNALKALQQLSSYHRSALNIPIIGITGSNGKTTSKELINCVLSTSHKVSATIGNLNNHIGVPLSILRISKSDDIGIIEMGTNGPGEIEFLCSLARPDIGLITSIGKAHLEGLGSLDGVVKEKTALYRAVAENNGKIIYNTESIHLRENLPITTENISYSKSGSNTFEIQIQSSFPSLKGNCKRGIKEVELRSKMYGAYNVTNIASALLMGELFDVNLESGVNAINNYEPKNNRSELRCFRGANIYLDAYNANPSSVALVINQFAESEGTKILILGDMLEVGNSENLEHRLILQNIEEQRFEQVILLGGLYAKHKSDFASFMFYTDFDAVKKHFESLDLNGKNILLKGSRGMGLERLIT